MNDSLSKLKTTRNDPKKNDTWHQQSVGKKSRPVRSRSLSAKRLSKFAFGPFQDGSLSLRQTFTGAVDVKVQH